MRSRPEHVTDDAIRAAVVAGWGLDLDEFAFLPEGGGAYHWLARTADGRRWFVTCDDLETKPWLGSDHDTVMAGLLGAYGAAMDLRAAGAAFVVAPLPANSGAPAQRVDERHSVALFDHLDGTPGQWGQPLPPKDLRELVEMLALLHRSQTKQKVRRRGLEIPGRAQLEDALAHLGGRWEGGPLSEAARAELEANEDTVATSLAALDRAAAHLTSEDQTLVLAHGEPHPGNLIRTSAGVRLVDWDTVSLAPPESDLWMIAEADPELVPLYEQQTGIRLDPEVLKAFRLLWATSDVA
ncbi:MAG: phosphotransferase, partial [Actinobacteria bacterium]|nr:phosphotransferase [Actinomycetota bacterium]